MSGDRGTPNLKIDRNSPSSLLSNNEEEEVVPNDQIAPFFSGEGYQALLCKCLSALDLKGPPPGEQSQETDTHPSNKSWGSGEFFPNQRLLAKVFLFPIFFERQLKAE